MGSPINNNAWSLNAWSLEVEVQFYLLMPLLAAVLWLPPADRRSLLVLAIAVLSTNPHGFRRPHPERSFSMVSSS
jgi:peptidoglycan/LPS O-acetylase OafA/YrhL